MKNCAASLDGLLLYHNELKKNFNDNICFRFLREGKFSTDLHKDKFLSYFQVLSDHFQKAMLIKTALCYDPYFLLSFKQHLREEVGHDDLLRQDRNKNDLELEWDPILDAVTNWFPSKMLSTSHYEQIVIMNLCIEGAALIIYQNAKPALDPNNEFNYFNAHGEVDIEHESLGRFALENLSEPHYKRLIRVLHEAWGMIYAVMTRIAELTIQSTEQTRNIPKKQESYYEKNSEFPILN